MDYVEKSIQVDVNVRTAYDQWTQFEEFPKFMEGVKEVKQLDDKHLRWRASIAGKEEEWTADIDEQDPDQVISWHSTSGAKNTGRVTFNKILEDRTLVTVRIEYDPKGMVENVGDTMGLVGRRVEGDLKRFKEFIESRGTESGSWRGEIHGSNVEPPGPHPKG